MLAILKNLTGNPPSPRAAMAAQRATDRQSERRSGEPGGPGRPWTRSPEQAQDKVLSAAAIDWIDRLPATVRPTCLAQTYPRLANRLMLCWADPTLAALLLNNLTNDNRGGRQGFPAPVATEIFRLCEYLALRPVGRATRAPFDPWLSQATSDR